MESKLKRKGVSSANADSSGPKQAGCFFVVATPIGNLADMTFRAVETLKQVAWIGAEDTRNSRHLLSHYGIDTPLSACHEHNEARMLEKIIETLDQGLDVALISDAGTPLINDPGYLLVHELRQQGYQVVPVPGACSPIAALSAAGLPTQQFSYMGFVPKSGSSKQQWMQMLAATAHTVVALETPKRLLKTLNELAGLIEGRQVCIAREITKLYETFVSGEVHEVIAYFDSHPLKGELVMMIGPAPMAASTDADILALAGQQEMQALAPSRRAREIAKRLGVNKSRVYDLLLSQEKADAP